MNKNTVINLYTPSLIFFLLITIPFLSLSQTPIQTPNIKGSLIRYEQFNSKFVDARTIDVWLPKNFKKRKKYAVLYMHDGQMLFDSSTT